MTVIVVCVTALVALVVAWLLRRWDVWRWLAVLVALGPVLAWPAVATGPDAPRSALALLLATGALAALVRDARPTATARVVGAALALAAAVAAVGAGRAHDPSATDVPAAPLLVAGLVAAGLIAAAGAAGLGRSACAPLRRACGVLLAVPLVVSLPAWLAGGATATSAWWLLATWLPAAGALGLTGLLRGRRGPAAARPQSDDVDAAALAEFDRRYATPLLAPVVVVIAAYNESRGIADVLASLPLTVCDLPTDVLVVDDGSSDDTAQRVREAPRGHLLACARNRGQGAALRLGYRAAREHGARYVLTTDADGQYDAADLAVALEPVLAGRADFVTGSRLLGRQQTRDRVRRAGVHVFAWLVSALVGHRVTDTSFGLRAMRVEVTETVTLNQPQYQSSELLVGAFSHGFTVAEVPGTMHVRAAGVSKKGTNLVYGRSYAGVVLGTWWREGCPAPITTRAAALWKSDAPAAG